MSLGALVFEGTASMLAAISSDALDRPLRHDAELLLGVPTDDAIVLGALQRPSEVKGAVASTLLHRGSCGAEARVGQGTLWLQLALTRPDALVACEPSRLLNRYVRPLLRALASVGVVTRYFDRDWLSAGKRPVGMLAFAHDTRTGRSLVEAVIGIDTPFAVRPRPSYLGKTPATLADLGSRLELARVSAAVVAAYADAYGHAAVPMDPPVVPMGVAPRLDPPWTATREEAVGVVGAGHDGDGVLRIGGELMVSRDALTRLEERVAQLPPSADPIGAAVDEILGAPGVALLGVRSLATIRDVLIDARRV